MSETMLALLGFATIIMIIVLLLKNVTVPAIAFIGVSTVTALILVLTGTFTVKEMGGFIKAGVQVLKINKEWLTDGTGDMEAGNQAFQSAKLLKELYDIAKELSEDEQLFLLDTVKSLKLRLGKRQ